MHKLSHHVGDQWVEHSHPPEFSTDITGDGAERLKIGVPAGDVLVLRSLIGCLAEPFFILYVLHTPRGEGEPGRYQSPPVSRAATAEFLVQYAEFLSGDARYDIWVHSPESGATLVWDRQNIMFGYGPLDRLRAELHGLGFSEREMPPLGQHMHHYRSEFDADAASVLAAFDWTRTPLHPEDEQ